MVSLKYSESRCGLLTLVSLYRKWRKKKMEGGMKVGFFQIKYREFA